MQSVSGSWATNMAAAARQIVDGVQVSWLRSTGTTAFFTIGTSTIGGPDIIKSGGSAVAFFDKYAFSDYTNYVTAWSVDRRLGQYPYGVVMAQADLELDNSSKLFTPGYDGTIGNYILPNRPMKIGVGFGTESLQQFVGFTGVPEENRMDRTIALHAFDVFEYINGYTSSLGIQVGKYFQEIIDAAMIEMGFSASQYVLDQSLQQKIGYLAPKDRKWGDIFREGCEGEQAIMFADENGIIRFWNRQHFLLNTSSVHTLNFSNMVDMQTQSTAIFNDVIVRAKPRAVQNKQKVYELQASLILSPGSNFVPIDFADEFGPLPVTSVDVPAVGGATSRYVANNAIDGTGTDMSASVTVSSASLTGTSYLLTINNATGTSLYLTSLVIYGTPATVVESYEERYQNQTSIDTYGRNPGNSGEPLVIENDLIQDRATAKSLGYTLVNEYKDPHRRYRVTMFANPALQIGDFLTLVDEDTSISKSVYYTGSTIRRGRGGQLEHVAELEERTIAHYFTINSSTIGGTDTIAP